ncbi:glycosyl hydrolase catalytic core-domain-containing protein [Lophiotrema nucula]|uniref:Glycosyl hydrolase catalytic core-domain-containing protein n=1 Tax=Lophiotrema nucula TaxID=690887 RepID=A0A6A5Z7G5_9PLEO|nr:glycosyl hydrolase catalytic core-domain-containing protein [Lophiotrema nucula]
MIRTVKAAVLAIAPLAISTSSSKRGLCYVPSSKYPQDDKIWTDTPGSDLSWYYNYQSEPSSSYKNSDMEFVPMLWGASDSDTGTPFLDSVKAQINGGANISYVLGFNEPDGTAATGGSAVPAELAASTWIAQIEPLKELGVKLGAPAVTGAPNGFTWLQDFFTACDGGCTPDFIPVHWYGNFEGMASHVGQVMGTYPNMTVWVTEWGFPNQKLEATQEYYNMSSEWFDRMENITHYSYFGAFRSDVSNVGPNSALLTQNGKLTDIGSWYLGGAAMHNVPKGDSVRMARFAGWSLVVLATGVYMVL